MANLWNYIKRDLKPFGSLLYPYPQPSSARLGGKIYIANPTLSS
jgi:hypothetical protein